MQFGSAGTGSATHLGCVLMNYLLGVSITHVPYRGTGPALQDLEGGRIDYLCDVMTTAKPPIESGAVKGLAVFDSKRSPALPDVPSSAEQGMPNLIAYTWNAIYLPKNAPAPIVKKLHDATLAAMHTPAVRERLSGTRRRDRARRPGDTGLSREIHQERDREVGGADQGGGRQRGMT